jgi:hypothetical protein
MEHSPRGLQTPRRSTLLAGSCRPHRNGDVVAAVDLSGGAEGLAIYGLGLADRLGTAIGDPLEVEPDTLTIGVLNELEVTVQSHRLAVLRANGHGSIGGEAVETKRCSAGPVRVRPPSEATSLALLFSEARYRRVPSRQMTRRRVDRVPRHQVCRRPGPAEPSVRRCAQLDR